MRVFYNKAQIYLQIIVANGIKQRVSTKVRITNAVFCFTEFFIVMCPGPKKKGDGTAADGVMADNPDAIQMIIANAARLNPRGISNAAPTLKNRASVTVLDRKFVISTARLTNTMIRVTLLIFETKGFSMFLIHVTIPVTSELIGTAIHETVQANITTGKLTFAIVSGRSMTGFPLI